MILEGVAGIPVLFSFLQNFFAGIPVGQEFLYLTQNPPDSGGFRRIPVPAKSCWLWPATEEGTLLSKLWTVIGHGILAGKYLAKYRDSLI